MAFVLLALLLDVAVSTVRGGAEAALLWIWAVFSGYVPFVFLLGRYAWRKTLR
ncbi:hypothetical protein GQF42_37035 [Streptomyces broussonetiae]|uniref:Uncharacterized protein n=1 Tax=Streptomyces broussonetiae TaxID=2686304 RepID=A0A6I6NDP5_9ACTN|nr:hypothetical protein [Streptomyces broussonetiae]QHA08130.1 hypothetical protein GQF42_37035 [Streptomyces broussonetiae]